jgi:F-type H+-transporting ATPase subunit alpha
MKSVAGTLRLSLAQFRELEAFMQFAQDLDAETAKRIDTGRRMVEVLKQGKHAPLPFEQQVAVLYAAANGTFSTVEVGKVRAAELELLTFLDDQHSSILDSIRQEKKITDVAKTQLDSALELFLKAHTEFAA